MDGREDDFQLQRTAAQALEDVSFLIKIAFWKNNGNSRRSHRYVRETDLAAITKLFDPFQEDPQLLDAHLRPFLADLTPVLVDGVSRTTIIAPKIGCVTALYACCKIINQLCRIRGWKVIVHLLNNEPIYLEVVLAYFELHQSKASHAVELEWEARYVLLLWLAHLVIAPFDLSTVSSASTSGQRVNFSQLPELPWEQLPSILCRLVQLSVQHLHSPTKEKEAAAVLLARLCLRPDSQRFGLLSSILPWIEGLMTNYSGASAEQLHYALGLLRVLTSLVASSSSADIDPLLPTIQSTIQKIVSDEQSTGLWASAVTRKLIAKVSRSKVLCSLHSSSIDVSESLEETIDLLLRLLADPDTQVRYAASKSLSLITLELEPSLASEVIEAVLGSLNENVLWVGKQRDLAAVDPLRWHGLILTLSHLLYRHAPSIKMIPDVLKGLLLALRFEQRTSTSSSIGANVRDAACFGIWALARRYSRKELAQLDPTAVDAAVALESHSSSLQQGLATELVAAACLDPVGNVRRASSAALQELVGRHPDTVIDGITLIQIVDFQAVGLRERAFTKIAPRASHLHATYWNALFSEILGWRGLGSPDAPSRTASANAVGFLSRSSMAATIPVITEQMLKQLCSLKPRQIEERHGLLLGLAQLLESLGVSDFTDVALPTQWLQQLWSLFQTDLDFSDKSFTVHSLRPELTASSTCEFIAALAKLSRILGLPIWMDDSFPNSSIDRAVTYLDLSMRRKEPAVLKALDNAAGEVLRLLPVEERKHMLEKWLALIVAESRTHGAGIVTALTSGYSTLNDDKLQSEIVKTLVSEYRSGEDVESRLILLRGLSKIIKSLHYSDFDVKDHVFPILQDALNDYTVTERGDVGSHARIQAIGDIQEIWSSRLIDEGSHPEFLGFMLRLASEKLDKVRLLASQCLSAGVESRTISVFPEVPAAATTREDFYKLLERLHFYESKLLHTEIVRGYFSSMAMGSHTIIETSRVALADFLVTLPIEDPQIFSLDTFGELLLDLLQSWQADERILVGILDAVAFLSQCGVLQNLPESFRWKTLLSLLQKSHYKSTNIMKLSLAVDCYRGLSEIATIREAIIAKLTSMLLHPFPKIRIYVAESLLLITGVNDLKTHDWSLPASKLKAVVAALKSRLSIT